MLQKASKLVSSRAEQILPDHFTDENKGTDMQHPVSQGTQLPPHTGNSSPFPGSASKQILLETLISLLIIAVEDHSKQLFLIFLTAEVHLYFNHS